MMREDKGAYSATEHRYLGVIRLLQRYVAQGQGVPPRFASAAAEQGGQDLSLLSHCLQNYVDGFFQRPPTYPRPDYYADHLAHFMAERVFASVVDDVERETEEAEVRLRELKRSLRFHRSRLQRLRSERPEALNVVPHSRMEALERSKRRFVKHAMPYVVGELAASSFPAPTAPLQQSAAPPGQGRLSQGDGLATPPRSQRLSPPREAPGLAQDYLPPHMTRRLLRAISSQKSRYESRIAELEARLGESQPPSPAASRAGRSASARTKTPGTTRASPRSPHSGGPSVQPMPVSALPQHIPRSPAAAERLGESSPR